MKMISEREAIERERAAYLHGCYKTHVRLVPKDRDTAGLARWHVEAQRLYPLPKTENANHVAFFNDTIPPEDNASL